MAQPLCCASLPAFSHDSLGLDDHARTRRGAPRVVVTVPRARATLGLSTSRCAHCGARAPLFASAQILRAGAGAVGVVRAAFIGLWLALAVGFVLARAPHEGFGAEAAERLAAALSVWALFGLIFGGLLLGLHAVFAPRLRLRMHLCGDCHDRAEQGESLRALFEGISLFASVLTLLGLVLYLHAPAACPCDGLEPRFLFLALTPGALLPLAAAGRLGLFLTGRERDIRLTALTKGEARLVLPRAMWRRVNDGTR